MSSLQSMRKGEQAQRAFDRSMRNIREQISAKDFERLKQMSSLGRFVEEGQRIGNELKTKGASIAASKVGSLALNIEPYARIVEGLCKLAPIGGDLLWGLVSFLLVISGTNANILGDVLSFFMGIAEEISYLQLVEDTFIGSEMVVTAVGAVYVAVIEFWVKAVEYYAEKMKTDVRSRIKMWLISSTTLSREFVKLKDKISVQKTKLHEIEVSQNNAIEKVERVRRQQKEISDFISAPEYDNHRHAAERHRHDGTCEWLRYKEEYRDWTGRLTSGLLVIYGTAGAGKTILSSWLINQAQSRPAHHITLYHFFKGTDEKSNTALSATRSFLHQAYIFLLSTNDLLVDMLESRVRNLLLNPSIRFESLWDILYSLFSEYSQRCKQEATPTITLILDAMDECEDPTDLVKSLRKLVHATSNTVHVVMTGRPFGGHVDELLSDDPDRASPRVLHIAPNDVQDDIAAFVKHSINNIERLGASKHHSLRDRTIATLSNVKNHQGMFLWADLMCKEVQKQQRVTGIETLLEQLPSGLNGMYERICERLLASDKIDLEFSRRVLEWVVGSKRPMTFAELEEALKFTTSDDVDLMDQFFDGDGGLIWSRRDIVKCCGDLVRYSGLDEGDTISIVHLSAQQFLSTRTQNPSNDTLAVLKPFSINIPSTQLRISITCIRYLLFFFLKTHHGIDIVDRNVSRDQYSLFDYATIYWVDYATDATESGLISDATQLQQLLTTIIEFTLSPASTIWLEELIRLTYIEFAQHVIRRLKRLDVIYPPDILDWLDLVYKVLVDYSNTLSPFPQLVQLCISQPQLPNFRSSKTTHCAVDLSRCWIHYDSDHDNIISIIQSSQIALNCESLKTGIRSRPNVVEYHGLLFGAILEFQCAAVSPSTNHIAVGYRAGLYHGHSYRISAILIICWRIKNSLTASNIEDWATLAFRDFIPATEHNFHTNPIIQWVQDDTILTPRGAFDLQTKRYVDIPRAIYELDSKHQLEYSFSGDGKRVAWIKHNMLEVLSTEGVSVCQVRFPESSGLRLQSISHSGGKVVVSDIERWLLCCIVVDQARRIDMSFACLGPFTPGVFTTDERQFVAGIDENLTVWTFQQELDGSYHHHADMTHVFVSQYQWIFNLAPGAAVTVDINGKFTRQLLDPEQPAGQAINSMRQSLPVLKYTGLVPELKICSTKDSLIRIEHWSLELPHPKLIFRTESPMPVTGYLRTYSPQGTYLATDRWIIDTRTLPSEFGVRELDLPEGAGAHCCEFSTDETLFAYLYDNDTSGWKVCVLDVSQGLGITQRTEFTLECKTRPNIILFNKHNPALLAVGQYLLKIDDRRLSVETQIKEEIAGFSECGSYYYDCHSKLYKLPTRLAFKVPMDIKYLPRSESYVHPPHRFTFDTLLGIVSLTHRLNNVKRSRIIYVTPDGIFMRSRGSYLIWPKEDVESMKLLLVLDEGPTLVDTGIKRGDLVSEDKWKLHE